MHQIGVLSSKGSSLPLRTNSSASVSEMGLSTKMQLRSNEVLCVDSFRTGEMVPVRFLPQGGRGAQGIVGAASDRAFNADTTAPLHTRVRRARDAGYRAGLDEERRSVLQGLRMSSENPLATPDEAELVFSLLRGELDAV